MKCTHVLHFFVDHRLNFLYTSVTRKITRWLLSKIEEYIDTPDSGLWEFHETIQHYYFTHLFNYYSKLHTPGYFTPESPVFSLSGIFACIIFHKFLSSCPNRQKPIELIPSDLYILAFSRIESGFS